MRTRPAASALFPVALLLLGLSARASADELYRQTAIGAVGGYSSQDARNPGGLGWFSEVADDFTAPVAWTITGVEFWGGYVTEQPANTHGFTVRFYDDGGGTVGPRVHEQDVATFTEEAYYTFPSNNWHGFHYTLALPQPFIASPGTHWVSIVAILDRGGTSTEPQWGWAQAPAVAGSSSVQWFFSPGNFRPLNVDMGFVLNGTTGGMGTTGACCRGSGCTLAAAASCTGSNTRFAGNNTVCNAPGANTAPCCRADFNQSGTVTVQDIFDFLIAYFAGDALADVNGVGGVTVQDIFDYLSLYFVGCS